MRTVQQAAPAILYLAADRPYRTLAAAFESGGIQTDRMHFLDAVTSLDGRTPERRPNVTFVPSPTMLEMLAMRIEQLAGRLGRPHVIVDSLSTLALYSGTGAVQQFTHYVINRMRSKGWDADLLVADTPEGRVLQEQVGGHVDSFLELRRPA